MSLFDAFAAIITQQKKKLGPQNPLVASKLQPCRGVTSYG
jgi:hypothetical protein